MRAAISAVLAAALIAIGCLSATPIALAAWEPAQRIDNQTEGFTSSLDGDIGIASNGLATAFFFQDGDSGLRPFMARRAAGDATWAAPAAASLPAGYKAASAPLPALAVGGDGSAISAFHFLKQVSPGPVPPAQDEDQVVGEAWPAGAAAPSGPSDTTATANGGAPIDIAADAAGNAYMVTQSVRAATQAGSPPGSTVIFRKYNASTGKWETPIDVGAAAPSNDPSGSKQGQHPAIDVNANGDIAVSFAAAVTKPEETQEEPQKVVVYVQRKLASANAFSDPQRISQVGETDNVTENDVAIDPSGNITVAFAADPSRSPQNRIYARRWLASFPGPRIESSTELVSSAAASEPSAGQPKIVSDPQGRTTAAWVESGALYSGERANNAWTAPQKLATSARFDLAVDSAGVATVVYIEGTAVKARRRASGATYDTAAAVSSAAPDPNSIPKVAAASTDQAALFFIQNVGNLKSAFASLWKPEPPPSPSAPPPPPPPPPAPTPKAPSIKNLTQSHRQWREGKKIAIFSRKPKRAPLGTTFSFTLNAQAIVSLTFTQQLTGRSVNGKCIAQTKKNHKRRACKLKLLRGSISSAAHAGTNRIRFQGRLTRSKALPLGRYQGVFAATNEGGHSTPRSLYFTIVK